MSEWRVIHGDCLDVMAGMLGRGEKVAHVITDPPYEAEAHTLQRRVKRSDQKTSAFGGPDARVAMVEPLEFPPMAPHDRSLAGELISGLAARWSIAFCQVEAAMLWKSALVASGAHNYRRTGVWVKPDAQPQLSGDRPGMGYESVVFTHAKGRSVWNGGGRSSVFTHIKNTPGGSEHPTTKPLPLMLELVELFTDPGDTILDPYCGSGTTGLACKILGRDFIGIEKSQKFARIAEARIAGTYAAPTKNQTNIFDLLAPAK